jgi:hypothetical protein
MLGRFMKIAGFRDNFQLLVQKHLCNSCKDIFLLAEKDTSVSMNKEPTSRTDYILAAIAGLISLYIVFSMSFPMSLLPVTGIFAITGFVLSPILKRRQSIAEAKGYGTEALARTE